MYWFSGNIEMPLKNLVNFSGVPSLPSSAVMGLVLMQLQSVTE
jgi:hypothetical protein